MTGFAQATTNGAGLQLVAGLDVSSIKYNPEFGARVDPWTQISKVKSSKLHTIGDFFAENSKGNLIYRPLASYNMLMRHIMREMSPKTEDVVEIKKNGSARQITLGGDVFLLFKSKIYRRKVGLATSEKEE
jgi:hypothetical protein